MQTFAGLMFDNTRHYLDHLAPFCALKRWPLIICEGIIVDLARRYYPNLEIIESRLHNITFPKTLVICETKPYIESIFGQKENCTFLWLPHGNSDKGWGEPFFHVLRDEISLVYGQKMLDFMSAKNTSSRKIQIGNFRLKYWLENREFYDALIAKDLPSLANRKTYLYAPTWDDSEDNCSFWQMFPLLLHHLPTE